MLYSYYCTNFCKVSSFRSNFFLTCVQFAELLEIVCWSVKESKMELDMVADKEVDKVAGMVAGHGCWLILPKLLRPKPYLACVSSKSFASLFSPAVVFVTFG